MSLFSLYSGRRTWADFCFCSNRRYTLLTSSCGSGAIFLVRFFYAPTNQVEITCKRQRCASRDSFCSNQKNMKCYKTEDRLSSSEHTDVWSPYIQSTFYWFNDSLWGLSTLSTLHFRKLTWPITLWGSYGNEEQVGEVANNFCAIISDSHDWENR